MAKKEAIGGKTAYTLSKEELVKLKQDALSLYRTLPSETAGVQGYVIRIDSSSQIEAEIDFILGQIGISLLHH